jgi:hypothetical protein
VLEAAHLVRRHGAALELTPEGMFYADAVAGLFARERVAELRMEADDLLALHLGMHMG